MTSPVETCPDWITVQRCVEDVALRTHHSTLVLTAFDGHPSGLLHLPRLARIPTQQRETLRVRDVATPLPQGSTCAPDDLLEDVLEKLTPGGGMPSSSWTARAWSASSPRVTSPGSPSATHFAAPKAVESARLCRVNGDHTLSRRRPVRTPHRSARALPGVRRGSSDERGVAVAHPARTTDTAAATITTAATATITVRTAITRRPAQPVGAVPAAPSRARANDSPPQHLTGPGVSLPQLHAPHAGVLFFMAGKPGVGTRGRAVSERIHAPSTTQPPPGSRHITHSPRRSRTVKITVRAWRCGDHQALGRGGSYTLPPDELAGWRARGCPGTRRS